MPTPACLHLLCGKAGAGKSTLATALAQAHHAILICEDVWLARLFGDQMKTFQRNAERPEGSHHLTEADFVQISSFFEAPEATDGFRIEVHGAARA